MKRILGTLAVLAVVAAPSLATAGLDAPHDLSFASLACDNCHGMTTTPTGGSGKQDFTLGCLSCHNSAATRFPWASGDQAVPGVGGKHHSWSGFAENPSHGASSPVSTVIATKLVDGKLQCSVCHDPHRGAQANAPNSQRVSQPVNVALDPTSGSSTAKMTILTVPSYPIAFRVKASTSGGIIVSHDYGLTTPSWFNWSGGAWVAGVDNGPGRPVTANTALALDDANATVKFTAAPPTGASWDFVVSYPFVRVPVGADEMCTQCHAKRIMGSTVVSGEDTTIRPNGTRLFSHPVGEQLGANGGGYDRTLILDANGATSQTTGDGIAGNNLVLRGNTVMCTTCHAIHSGDSNSLTP